MKNRLIFVVFLIWAAVVTYFYHSVLPADFKKFLEYISTFPVLFNFKGVLLFAREALIGIFLACFLFAVSYIIGRKLTNSLKKDFDTPGFFAVSAAVGFSVISGFIFLIAAAGLLYEAVIFTAFIILCVYALLDLYRNPSRIRFEPKKYDGSEKLLFIIIGVFMLMNLFLALTPETFFDSLEYHLAVPSAYILNHGFTKMPYNLFSGFPGNAELLYLAGLVLNGPVTAKLINFLFGVLLLVSVYSFSKKYVSRRAGLFASGLVCIMPVVAVNLINTQVDALSAFWFFLSFYLAVSAAEKGFSSGSKILALAGLFAGFGLGVKYSGIIYAAGIAFVLLYYCLKNRSFNKIPYVFSVFFLFALIPVVPWLVKNYLFFGNPVYPY
ncbi:MAG: glycosyltransferase family 39 protein, partial [Candidatus Firestonebacteria bacterium]